MKNLQKVLDFIKSRYWNTTTKQLRKEDSFCIEGAVCEAYRSLTGKGYWDRESFVLKELRHSAYLPRAVCDWLGLPDDLLAKDEKGRVIAARDLNDQRGFSIPETVGCIARYYNLK